MLSSIAVPHKNAITTFAATSRHQANSYLRVKYAVCYIEDEVGMQLMQRLGVLDGGGLPTVRLFLGPERTVDVVAGDVVPRAVLAANIQRSVLGMARSSTGLVLKDAADDGHSSKRRRRMLGPRANGREF
jgi:hypothetical protein